MLSQADYNCILAFTLAFHLLVKNPKISQRCKPRVFSDLFCAAFSPGHMHCLPDSLVYVEAFQCLCIFLSSLLLPRLFGLSVLALSITPCPSWAVYVFKLFQQTLPRKQLQSWKSFKGGARRRQMPKPVPQEATRQIKRYNHNSLRTKSVLPFPVLANHTQNADHCSHPPPPHSLSWGIGNSKQISKNATIHS